VSCDSYIIQESKFIFQEALFGSTPQTFGSAKQANALALKTIWLQMQNFGRTVLPFGLTNVVII
jgi:hypothetical protein